MKSKKWLNIYLPPGELAMLKLIEYKLLDNFYNDSFNIFKNLISDKYHELMYDAFMYNKFLLQKPSCYKRRK